MKNIFFIILTVLTTARFSFASIQTLELDCEGLKTAYITYDLNTSQLSVTVKNTFGRTVLQEDGFVENPLGSLEEDSNHLNVETTGLLVTTGLIPKKSIFSSPWSYDRITSIQKYDDQYNQIYYLACKRQ